MNKKELIDVIADSINVSKVDAEKAFTTLMDSISKALISKQEVNIPGFGKFVTVDKEARQGVNPKTGEKIQIAAKTAVKFKVAKQLKDAVA